MGNSPEEDEHISEDVLLQFINGLLSYEEAEAVEILLRNSKETFLKYISLKETLFLESKGKKISKEMEDKIISSILPKRESNFLRILVRYKKEQVFVTSSDQAALAFEGFMTEFNGISSASGPISISRKIIDREVTLIVQPGDNLEERLLSLNIERSKGIKAELFVDSQLSDRIEDLSQRQLFLPSINSSNSVEIKLIEEGKVFFTIGLFLQIEQ
ncbi:hypothetical protein LEP1GSC050_2827 [Leptospira broomii serovar Hurstbridge str. 5399]|uniref:Uncharacterized protein n=1 Tax=Leptospira broomii serovar Hurstbridge str. 5399 TaxID=1049789 RepID=T0F4M5_9LEPT|nr:hypothetical protein [Leptospira broomii]EQA46040.1 hypothetical protein LEP1GSC050_2827 [Leptospira broomii serovar Hurstbridge str. 5399]